MKLLISILSLLINSKMCFSITNATYNSFIEQIGYCKMQSFHTTSRSTSGSILAFLDGRIKFGVGLSDENIKKFNFHACGACLNITHHENLGKFNSELNQSIGVYSSDTPITVMVFDQCTDPICTKDFIDFDIYSPLQPVSRGNPYHIDWELIPCPISKEETIEYILCFPDTCHFQDKEAKISKYLNETFFWSITIRNHVFPIKEVSVFYLEKKFPLSRDNSWTWNQGLFQIQNKSLSIEIMDFHDRVHNDTLHFDDAIIRSDYHGGMFFQSRLHL